MSVELTLLPFDGPWFSQTVLELGAVPEEDFPAYQALPLEAVPNPFNSYLAPGPDGPFYGTTAKDKYGSPLQATAARHLVKLFEAFDYKPPAYHYLRALSPSILVALYWH